MWLRAVINTSLQSDNALLLILDNEALSTDELARKLNKPVSEIGSELSMLLLSGHLIERGGKYYLNDAS